MILKNIYKFVVTLFAARQLLFFWGCTLLQTSLWSTLQANWAPWQKLWRYNWLINQKQKFQETKSILTTLIQTIIEWLTFLFLLPLLSLSQERLKFRNQKDRSLIMRWFFCSFSYHAYIMLCKHSSIYYSIWTKISKFAV